MASGRVKHKSYEPSGSFGSILSLHAFWKQEEIEEAVDAESIESAETIEEEPEEVVEETTEALDVSQLIDEFIEPEKEEIENYCQFAYDIIQNFLKFEKDRAEISQFI